MVSTSVFCHSRGIWSHNQKMIHNIVCSCGNKYAAMVVVAENPKRKDSEKKRGLKLQGDVLNERPSEVMQMLSESKE